MALDDIIRSSVAIADNVTKSLQVNVSHFAWIADNDFSQPDYSPEIIRKAIVEYAQRLRKTGDGQEIMQQASILFVGPIRADGAVDRREPIDPRDKIILPNGYTGPILSVEGVVDPDTNSLYTVEVILG